MTSLVGACGGAAAAAAACACGGLGGPVQGAGGGGVGTRALNTPIQLCSLYLSHDQYASTHNSMILQPYITLLH